MRLILLLLFAVCCSGGVQAFLITEVYPDSFHDGDADEYLVLSGPGSLEGLEITDGEGTIRFPQGAVSGGQVTIARDGEVFRLTQGRYPDYELIPSSPAVPEPLLNGKVQLANKKDELRLTWQGVLIQNLTWPGTFRPRKGQVHYASPDGIWDERVLMAGASRFPPLTFSDVPGTAFVSPDCGRDLLASAIRSAKKRILVNVYEFTDGGIADLLCEARKRGVEVTVLTEGGPVGGIPPEEQAVIARLDAGGIPVTAMTGAGEDHAPYRFNHAKYLVIDDGQVLLTTENFKDHSFPPDGLAGNRGWGVLLSSPPLAAHFSEVFAEDLNGPGVSRIHGYPSDIPPYTADRYQPVFSPVSFTASSVTTVLAPDSAGQVLPLIDGAEHRLFIAEAYISHWSGGRKNPYLQAAINASRRGVDVRILLDSYYYNIEDDADNDEMVQEITTIAGLEHLPLEARLMDTTRSGLLKLHAKGVIADDTVFISSINWNENSPVFNREAGLIIRDRHASGYFASVFEKDWQGGGPVPGSPAPGADDAKIRLAILVLLFLVVLYWYRHRWRR